jgi:two-component system OmpR family response regulator
MTYTILVIDDDEELRNLLQTYLSAHDYRVLGVADGAAMRTMLRSEEVDLIILDLMLPGEDGLALCKALRSENAVPILMISAQGDEVDRIVGLEVGADHYLPKPFSPREMLAHVRSLLRRSEFMHPTNPQRLSISFAGWTLDLRSHHLCNPEGIVTPLSAGEFRVLKVLAQNANHVLSRDQLLDALSGRSAEPFDRTVDTIISRLRRRLRDTGKEPFIIRTVRSEGYMLVNGLQDRQ